MNQTNNTETQIPAPHVPKLQGEKIYGPISNTAITTFIFFILMSIFVFLANRALKKEKSRLKEFMLNVIGFIDEQLIASFGEKKFARKYLPLIAGIFFIILFGNLFGLIIDWIGGSISSNFLHYLRPINSDLNTTLVLAIITVFTFLKISVSYKGGGTTVKGFLFNWEGKTIGEKCINVFVGWLHLIGVPSTIASLSLRLFGNIFAGIVLIGIISYLGTTLFQNFLPYFEAGKLLSLPFWFFEIFVAFIQAVVFAMLMMAYFAQNKEQH